MTRITIAALSLIALIFVHPARATTNYPYDVTMHGAVGDAVWGITFCSIMTSGTEIHCPTHGFVASDVGKTIIVDDAGGEGPLVTTIASLDMATGNPVFASPVIGSKTLLARVTNVSVAAPPAAMAALGYGFMSTKPVA